MNIDSDEVQQASPEDSQKVIAALVAATGLKLTKHEEEWLPYSHVAVFPSKREFLDFYDTSHDVKDLGNISYAELANVLYYYPQHALVLRGEWVYHVYPEASPRFTDYVVEVDEDWGNSRVVAKAPPPIKPPKKGYKPDAAELVVIMAELVEYVRDHNGTYMHLPYTFDHFLNTRVSSPEVRDFLIHVQQLMWHDEDSGGHDLHKFLKTLNGKSR